MRIGIGALLVHPARSGGAETYARQLLQVLPAVEPSFRYTVLVPDGSDLRLEFDNAEILTVPAPVKNIYRRVIWEQTRFAQQLRKHRFDLVHFLGSTGPWNYRRPAVVSMHDTIRFQRPDLTPWLFGRYYAWIQRRNVRTGMRVIAGSRYAARLFQQHLPVAPERVWTAYYGVDEFFFERRVSGNGKSYLLWTGRLYKHKNVDVLLDAYQMLRQDGFEPPVLRIVGADGREQELYRRIVHQRGLSGVVSIEPRISPEAWHTEFPKLYQHALLFCFPSQYESFGLPVLEAMASGTSVIASDIPAHRELYTGVADLVPASDAKGWADAIRRQLVDPSYRQKRETQGRDFAAKFTWRACAEATVAVYRQLAQEPDLR